MSENDQQDLPGKVEGVEEGKAGDEKPPICEIGHKERQELEALLRLPRILVILKDYRMKLALGAGKVKKTSMMELFVEFKAIKEGLVLLNRGSLSLPLPDHVKEKFDLKSVETMERMAKELIHLHGELVKAGLNSGDVTNLAKKGQEIFGEGWQ